MAIFVNTPSLVLDGPEFIAWLDIMGMRRLMQRRDNIAAALIFKFHNAILDVPRDRHVRVYPVMDGAYITAGDAPALKDYLRAVLRTIVVYNLGQESAYWFIVRGAIARGFLMHGARQNEAGCPAMARNAGYASSLVVGEAVIQALEAEKSAPPFGMAVNEAGMRLEGAESLPSEDFHIRNGQLLTRVWRWHRDANLPEGLLDGAARYYQWCADNDRALGLQYDPARRAEHQRRLIAYFRNELIVE